MSNRCWRPANEFTNFTAQSNTDEEQFYVNLDFIDKFHINALRILQHFFFIRTITFNSGNTHRHSSVRSLHLLLAMASPTRKTFMDVGQMQRRRHHMTARGFQRADSTLYFKLPWQLKLNNTERSFHYRACLVTTARRSACIWWMTGEQQSKVKAWPKYDSDRDDEDDEICLWVERGNVGVICVRDVVSCCWCWRATVIMVTGVDSTAAAAAVTTTQFNSVRVACHS